MYAQFWPITSQNGDQKRVVRESKIRKREKKEEKAWSSRFTSSAKRELLKTDIGGFVNRGLQHFEEGPEKKKGRRKKRKCAKYNEGKGEKKGGRKEDCFPAVLCLPLSFQAFYTEARTNWPIDAVGWSRMLGHLTFVSAHGIGLLNQRR